MSVDRRGTEAAEQLWRTSTDLDVESRLAALHRAEGRSRRRRSVVGASLLVSLVAFGAAAVRPALEHDSPTPAPPGGGPASASGLGPGYEVVATSLSPSRRDEAIATLRDGQPAVVVVRRVGSDRLRVVWAAETPQELVRANPSRPVAVTWTPDGRRLVVLVARPPYGRASATDDLRLLTLSPDGSGRREVPARLGRCSCTDYAPTLGWSVDGRQLEVGVPRPDGADQVHVTLP